MTSKELDLGIKYLLSKGYTKAFLDKCRMDYLIKLINDVKEGKR